MSQIHADETKSAKTCEICGRILIERGGWRLP
jgi:ribosomal protein S27E